MATLHEVEGKRLWTGQGEKEGRLHLASEAEAHALAEALRKGSYRVAQVEVRERRKAPRPPSPPPPSSRPPPSRLGYTAARTMRIAQRLYEGVDLPEGTVGLITYMRTDSVRVAPEAVAAAREVIGKAFGPEYLPEAPRAYKNRREGVQDAHEAIRPTDPKRTPESVRPYLSEEEYRLYELIWRRFLASQMRDALYEQTAVTLADLEGRYAFRASGSVLRFEGYLRAWGRDAEEEEEPPSPRCPRGFPPGLRRSWRSGASPSPRPATPTPAW